MTASGVRTDGDGAAQLVEHLFRRQSGQLVATLTRVLGARHVALAEDAVQDALVAALQTWPFRGVPDRPEAWLFQVARNRARDRLRHGRMVGARAARLPVAPPVAGADGDARLRGETEPLSDDQLGLMSLTCHPALTADARVALTLRLVGGFSVAEIARAGLASATTVAQRLVRAKRQLREIDAAFGVPAGAALTDRLASMQASVYLLFNEGYAATAGDQLVRRDVAGEALRLGRLLAAHPDTGTPASWALLSLMLLHAARFDARVGEDGVPFLLDAQDRSRWDGALAAEGLRALDRAASGEVVSAYHLEAGIAACHVTAPSWEATDWPAILSLYDDLLALTGSPVVAVNRSIALAHVEGPLAGLAALDPVTSDARLAGLHWLPAVQGALWRDAGERGRALAAFRAARALAGTLPERRWLDVQISALA
ncbi:MAG: sigma-70 family RNA polymerase sigma factor [Vicinamibacterales bacterium]